MPCVTWPNSVTGSLNLYQLNTRRVLIVRSYAHLERKDPRNEVDFCYVVAVLYLCLYIYTTTHIFICL